MEATAQGKVVWKFVDHFNADLIVGSRYIEERDPEVLGKVCLADFDPEFSGRVKPGDIMVAGRNFGYGHPHYQGLISLKKLGIATLISESFYPTWYRMAAFYGFPIITCPGIAQKVEVGQELHADFKTGQVKNLTTGETLEGEPLPPFLMEIIDEGGMVPYLKKQVA